MGDLKPIELYALDDVVVAAVLEFAFDFSLPVAKTLPNPRA